MANAPVVSVIDPLEIRRWDEPQCAQARELWQGLLQRSAADPLFMSWDWQWRWWAHHAQYLRATLLILGFYSSDRDLVGIAPLYVRNTFLAGKLPLRRIELIGQAWRDPHAVFSEYLDLIVARGHEEAVIRSLAQWLEGERDWDDLALPYLKAGSLAHQLACEHLASFSHVREVDPVVGYSAPLPESFDLYSRGLASGVRRKVLHQRRKLHNPMLVSAEAGEVGGFMEALRALESRRWGPKQDLLYGFNEDVARFYASAGSLRLTRLVSAERTLSVMYVIRVGSTEYYLQSAFEPEASKGMTLGYLHFGYQIEAACAAGVKRFDFLAGTGRQRDYKCDLGSETVTLVCCHAIRSSWLRALYRLRRLVSGWRSRGPRHSEARE